MLAVLQVNTAVVLAHPVGLQQAPNGPATALSDAAKLTSQALQQLRSQAMSAQLAAECTGGSSGGGEADSAGRRRSAARRRASFVSASAAAAVHNLGLLQVDTTSGTADPMDLQLHLAHSLRPATS